MGPGDRVAGFLPNLPETVIAMLAAASLGAVWSSCSPDFGVNGVVDRFGQIRPKVLICADGYRYAGKAIDSLARMREVCVRLPGIERVVVVPYLDPWPDLGTLPGAVRWDELLDAHRGPDQPAYAHLPFDHPLCIMYSSGTTGLPKCMVHGAGGTLLQHLKELALHTDVGPDDRVFYFTTCGWMMWNWLVSALAVGATVVLFDGAPLAPPPMLWDMAAEERRHGVRDQRQVPGARGEGGARAGAHARSVGAPRDALDRQPARGDTASTTCTQRSSATCTWRASAAAPTSSPASRSATRWARSGAASCRCAGSAWRWTSSTRTAGRCAGRRASWCAPAPFPACPSRSGTIPTAPSTGRRISMSIPGSGGMGTGPG